MEYYSIIGVQVPSLHFPVSIESDSLEKDFFGLIPITGGHAFGRRMEVIVAVAGGASMATFFLGFAVESPALLRFFSLD